MRGRFPVRFTASYRFQDIRRGGFIKLTPRDTSSVCIIRQRTTKSSAGISRSNSLSANSIFASLIRAPASEKSITAHAKRRPSSRTISAGLNTCRRPNCLRSGCFFIGKSPSTGNHFPAQIYIHPKNIIFSAICRCFRVA